MSANIENLLSRLEKTNSSGQDKWRACCPAHDDRSPSLAIKLTDDGKILIHCFAGCSAPEIVDALGMNMSDLMPYDPSYRKSGNTPRFNKYELFDKLLLESRILSIAIRQILSGNELPHNDLSRVVQAENTINDLAMEVIR